MRPITPDCPLQGVIFDFGSTLSITHTSWAAIITASAAALAGCLRDAGLQLPADFATLWVDMLRFSIQQAERDGNERTAEEVLALLLASQGVEAPDPALIRRATDAYFAVEDGWRAPASGAAALLAELKTAGYRVGILSNTIGGRWVQYWTDSHGFRPYVDAVITSDAIGIRKPRPEIFRKTLAELGLRDPATAVMVGDTLGHDIAGAQAVGMRTVLVQLAEDQGFNLTGADRAILARPAVAETLRADATITELAALAPILERWQADGV